MSTFLSTARAGRLPALSNADVQYLSDLVEAACAAVEKHCKRFFAQVAYTDEPYDGNARTQLFLGNFPVTTLASVTVTDPDGGQTQLAASCFDLNESTGEIRFKAGGPCDLTHFPAGLSNVAVSYTGGFATVPADVIEAAAQTALWLHEYATVGTGVASERLGDYSRTFRKVAASGLPASVKALLAPYRNVRV